MNDYWLYIFSFKISCWLLNNKEIIGSISPDCVNIFMYFSIKLSNITVNRQQKVDTIY